MLGFDVVPWMAGVWFLEYEEEGVGRGDLA